MLLAIPALSYMAGGVLALVLDLGDLEGFGYLVYILLAPVWAMVFGVIGAGCFRSRRIYGLRKAILVGTNSLAVLATLPGLLLWATITVRAGIGLVDTEPVEQAD